MALDAHMLVKGWEGTSVKSGHAKGGSIVHAVRHALVTPVDTAQGSVTHRRQHSLCEVDVLIDASIYQAYQAVLDKDKDGSKKLDVTLSFYRPDQANIGLKGFGETKPYYTMHLVDAFVASINFTMGDTRDTGGAKGGAAAGRQEYVTISFAYRQIEWTYMDGGKSSQDAWDAK